MEREGDRVGKTEKDKGRTLVREGMGEDRNHHHLVSANLRLVQLSVEAELSYGLAK